MMRRPVLPLDNIARDAGRVEMAELQEDFDAWEAVTPAADFRE